MASLGRMAFLKSFAAMRPFENFLNLTERHGTKPWSLAAIISRQSEIVKMDLSNLTDYQLYEIIQNSKLDNNIRKLANDEFNSRKLSIDQIQKIVLRHDTQFQPDKGESLKFKYRLLLILFPFFIPIQSAFSGRWLAKGQKRKWKDYWFYLSLGYLFWTIVIILLSKYFLFDTKTR